MSDKEIQPDIPDHYAFEPMPYFEPSKELLEAYHQALKEAEFVKKRIDHYREVLARIYDNGKNS